MLKEEVLYHERGGQWWPHDRVVDPEGFAARQEERQMEAGLPLFHSSMIVLLDDRLRVHMYYDGLGDDERIPGHVQTLLREKGGSG